MANRNGVRNGASPRTGAASAPVNQDSATYQPPRTAYSTPLAQRHSIAFPSSHRSLLTGQLSSTSLTSSPNKLVPPLALDLDGRRLRSSSLTGNEISFKHTPGFRLSPSGSLTSKKIMSVASTSLAKARARNAQKENDAMVYLDGHQIYACAQCRTHLTSHDDIISKSFHGRHGK